MPQIFRTEDFMDGSQDYYSKTIKETFNMRKTLQHPMPVTDSDSRVSYWPDPMEYMNRDSNLGRNAPELPHGRPSEATNNPLWDPQDIHESDYVYELTSSDLIEVMTALKFFKSQRLPLDAVSKSTFPLLTLGPTLIDIRDDIYDGIGFSVIRGLNLNDFNAYERAIVFLGVSSYIAEERGPQDHTGTMLKHLMDDEQRESLRELPFHTDVTCDVGALLTVQCSDHGGNWTVVPVSKVYNVLAKGRPDLIHILTKPDWPFDTFGRYPAYYHRAPLYNSGGKVIFSFSRRLLTGHPTRGRTSGVPTLTAAQAEALDMVQFVAKAHHLSVPMQDGDIRFINNTGLLHGREGFHDDSNVESRRHIMRLWLRNKDKSWKLPPPLQLAWARVFDDKQRPRVWIEEPFVKDGLIYGRGQRTECD